jgi:lipoate-protein ligase A
MAWRLLDFQQCSIFENMAIDEAIFHETIKRQKPPTIRFYSSHPAAVTIGYFQDAKKELNIEQCRRERIDVARRITGGRAVLHLNEVTYALVAGESEKIFPADIQGAYKIISACIARGLRHLGIDAWLAEEGRCMKKEVINPCCFATPLKNELLAGGRKICGSAQARKRGGFLQHGLLPLTFDAQKTADIILTGGFSGRVEALKSTVTGISEELARRMEVREICATLKRGFMEELGIRMEQGTLTPDEEKLKNKLMKKYTDINWNIERKKYFKAV